jgi:hypothetical protein
MPEARSNNQHATDWIYPISLVFGFVVIAATVPPAILREGLLSAFVIIVFFAVIAQLVVVRRSNSAGTRSNMDIVILAILSLSLSTLYWYRAAFGVSGWEGFEFGIVTSLAWWLPAAAFAALYRHPGERWLEQGRGRFFVRVAVVAVVASLPALPIHGALHERHAVRAEIAGLPAVIDSLAKRVLPEDAGFEYSIDDGVVHLDVTWPVMTETGNYRQIAMLHSLAGDAGAMRPGGVDRLVDRVNVEQVRLRVSRQQRLIAHMDWPQPDMRRGEQALVIDHAAAGLVPIPTRADLDDLLESIPGRYRTGNLCARSMDGEVWIGRCEEDPVIVAIDDAAELERDWQAANLLIREISQVFPEVSAFQVTLAGQHSRVPRDAVAPLFDARTFDAGTESRQHNPVPSDP